MKIIRKTKYKIQDIKLRENIKKFKRDVPSLIIEQRKNDQINNTDRYIKNVLRDLDYLKKQLRKYEITKNEKIKGKNVLLKIINENNEIRERVANPRLLLRKEENELTATYQKMYHW